MLQVLCRYDGPKSPVYALGILGFCFCVMIPVAEDMAVETYRNFDSLLEKLYKVLNLSFTLLD